MYPVHFPVDERYGAAWTSNTCYPPTLFLECAPEENWFLNELELNLTFPWWLEHSILVFISRFKEILGTNETLAEREREIKRGLHLINSTLGCGNASRFLCTHWEIEIPRFLHEKDVKARRRYVRLREFLKKKIRNPLKIDKPDTQTLRDFSKILAVRPVTALALCYTHVRSIMQFPAENFT